MSESLERKLSDMAATYHDPPATPREEMWRLIEDRIRTEGRPDRDVIALASRRRFAELRRWMPAAAAAGLVLALGVSIGRFTAPRAIDEAPAGVADAVANRGVDSNALLAATAEHLGRSEPLLALVRTDAGQGRVDPAVGSWGRSLLVETRLLLDSPASLDPAVRELLEDLELVLVEVVLMSESGSTDRGRAELELLARGLEERDLLGRIQAVLPSVSGYGT